MVENELVEVRSSMDIIPKLIGFKIDSEYMKSLEDEVNKIVHEDESVKWRGN